MHKCYDSWPLGEIKDELKAVVQYKQSLPLREEAIWAKIELQRDKVTLANSQLTEINDAYLSKESGTRGRTVVERAELGALTKVYQDAKELVNQYMLEHSRYIIEKRELNSLYAELIIRKQCGNKLETRDKRNPRHCRTCGKCFFSTHNLKRCIKQKDRYLITPFTTPLIT